MEPVQAKRPFPVEWPLPSSDLLDRYSPAGLGSVGSNLATWIFFARPSFASNQIPQKFEASARVYVDTESLLRPLLQGLAFQPNVGQQVALISRTLVSRPNASYGGTFGMLTSGSLRRVVDRATPQV